MSEFKFVQNYASSIKKQRDKPMFNYWVSMKTTWSYCILAEYGWTNRTPTDIADISFIHFSKTLLTALSN